MPSAGPKRPLSEPMSRWERSKTRWSDSGTGRNGRERLESGIGTTENTESTQRGGDEHGDERALGAGGGGSPAGPGGRLARAGRRPSKTARKGSKTGSGRFPALSTQPRLKGVAQTDFTVRLRFAKYGHSSLHSHVSNEADCGLHVFDVPAFQAFPQLRD